MQLWRLVQLQQQCQCSPKESKKIDVMIINIHPTNMISFNLLAQAMALDVISVGCYPKEILEVMIRDVPDLTRMQVASHLQKCRRNDWTAPEERKHIHQLSSQGSSYDSKKKSTFQKYGIMSQTERGTNFSISTLNTNQNFARGESSIQQQLYCPQRRVQPSYLNFIDQFNNSCFSTQNYAGDGLQQQHGPLFEMLASQGLQDSIIGNTNHSLTLEFDCENHHNISDFSLDLNVAHGATYQGCGTFGTKIRNATINKYNLSLNADKVSDTYVGSVTFNELGVANTNF
ncbi:hypothetical protein RDI58_022102 [Solanum bulbocastanum]|uniref:Uncharacterized protein n=1 Tax=Solanum bulbocastanum TaxID=147425 RepID=A0AAN8T8R4_SOLBU